MRLTDILRRGLGAFAISAALAAPARATWSIVAMDTRTGELLAVSATCLADFNLIRWTPVMVVGQGVGVAQSFIDLSGNNRELMFEELQSGTSPEQILALLDLGDSDHQIRQYGIVGVGGAPATFTGTGAGLAASGVVGQVGDIVYAIQGNVLTGDVVVTACEDVFVSTEGSMVDRAMAAMEEARAFGGDGRCSCPGGAPTDCGAPPPDFDKSAHTAFIVISRLGDTDGVCNTQVGCATGSYYLRRRAIGGVSDPDPMIELQRRVEAWRENKRPLADHYQSEVEAGASRLPADGVTRTRVDVRLVNLEGDALTAGGQTLSITEVSGGAALASVESIVDNGDGTHSFELVAGTQAGSARFRIEVGAGSSQVRLFPDLELELEDPTDLFVGRSSVSAAEPLPVPLLLDRGPAEAGRLYRVLASASGTVPGTTFGGLQVPLNEDRLLAWTLRAPGTLLEGAIGVLDPSGRAEASFDGHPAVFLPFLGSRFDFCAVLGPGPDEHTVVDGFEVLP